jgi:hypothetical protein
MYEQVLAALTSNPPARPIPGVHGLLAGLLEATARVDAVVAAGAHLSRRSVALIPGAYVMYALFMSLFKGLISRACPFQPPPSSKRSRFLPICQRWGM